MANDFPVTVDWIIAGKAIFTIYNGDGEHYTYKVSRKDNDASGRPPVWFVSLLTGSDNHDDYTYLGMLSSVTGKFHTTRASRMSATSTPVKVISWALQYVWGGWNMPHGYGIKGEGRCGRCGRRLTHPDGVADDGYRLGYGPHCWAKICGG